jgi:hypothetical protein
MIYHGRVTGPAGQVYQCEHNHRTLTAAVTCADSSRTRKMAALAWRQAAMQAAEAAALAKKRIEEQEAARARRVVAEAAAEARRAAAQAAAQKAKADKRSARLAAMTPRRAWKHMTPAERLLRTADLEMQAYGEVASPDAQAAYEARAAQQATPGVPPGTHGVAAQPIRGGSGGIQSGGRARALVTFAAVAGFIYGGLAAVVAGVVDGVVAFVHYKVTVPARCVVTQPDGSVIRTHLAICSGLSAELVWGTGLIFGVAVLMWIATVVMHSRSSEPLKKLTDP